MAQTGGKRKGLPPIQKGPAMMAPVPTIQETEPEKSSLSTFDEQELVIDPNLLVGPVYDNSKQRAKALKEQLGDINTRLQTTLTTFDTVNPFGQDEDMLGDLDKHVNGMESGQMKATLKYFINNYRDMSSHVQESSKEREDILFQLSDWFTLDHMDDLDAPVTQDDEKEADKNYTDALMNFEKFKRLQSQIKTASDKGLNVDHLVAEKRKLEVNVMGGFRNIKKAKETQRSGGDSTWKHAADEVVGLLRKVRGENTDELETLKKKVNGLVIELQQKSKAVDSLRKNLTNQKTMMSKFADENADLTDDVAKLKFKIKKLEVNLENATKLLQNQIDLSTIELPKSQDAVTGNEIKVTLSFVMRQLGEVTDANNLKRLTSDPALLRKQLRENADTIEAFSRELIKLAEQVNDLTDSCRRKEMLLMDMETANNQLRQKMGESVSDESLSRGSALSVMGVKMALSSNICTYCKSNLSSRTSISRCSSQELRPQVKKEETDRLYKKLDYFRKALSDAEMKLSQAYKEMAAMRRQSLAMDMSVTDLHKDSDSDDDDTTFKFQEPEGHKDKKKIVKESKRAKKNVRRKSIKPKSKKEKSLPPINQPVIPEPEEPPMPELEDDRENTLWQMGDIQNRLNLLITAIQSFATDVGKMIDKDDDDSGKQPTMQQFKFGQSYEEKSAKNAINQKVSEARQRRVQVTVNGQRAIASLREVYDLLNASLSLGHDDYEMIYRAFKKHQQIRAVHHAAMIGKLPGGTNVVRMGSSENAVEYYMKSYGGNGGGGGGSVMRGGTAQPWEVTASRVGNRPASETSSKGSTYPVLQRRLSKFKPKHASANNQTLPGLQRSKTIISTPFRHCDACTIKHLRNFNKVHSGGGSRFDDVVLVQGMKRSKSDLHFGQEGLHLNSMGMKGGESQHPQVFMVGAKEPRYEVVGGNKEEVLLPTAKIPKKGLIKLTSLEQEMEDPDMFNRGRSSVEPDGPKTERRKSEQQRSIIKRKDILDQIREGTRMLEEEELRKLQEEEEKSAQVEDYTLADLQSALGFVQDDTLEIKAINTAQTGDKRETPVKDASTKEAAQKVPKVPKLPTVTESIKQQTFQLPFLKK